MRDLWSVRRKTFDRREPRFARTRLWRAGLTRISVEDGGTKNRMPVQSTPGWVNSQTLELGQLSGVDNTRLRRRE